MAKHIHIPGETIYYTPSGEVVVPDSFEVEHPEFPPIPPMWLVFPNNIINLQHVLHIEYVEKYEKVQFYFVNGTVKEIKRTPEAWRFIQNLFGGNKDA